MANGFLEDFVLLDQPPSVASVRYIVTLAPNIAGLRLVEGTLEFLDGAGAPRLRMNHPYLIDKSGAKIEAALTVEGCAVDDSPLSPWGRQPVPPGRPQCALRIDWSDARPSYPAVLDPVWTATDVMTEPARAFGKLFGIRRQLSSATKVRAAHSKPCKPLHERVGIAVRAETLCLGSYRPRGETMLEST